MAILMQPKARWGKVSENALLWTEASVGGYLIGPAYPPKDVLYKSNRLIDLPSDIERKKGNCGHI